MKTSEPIWWNSLQPLGAAVRYVATLSPRVNWVGAYLLRGDMLHLGPFVGQPTDHTQIPVGRGVCGVAVLENKDQLVADVGGRSNYLACSIETRSELVILIKDSEGEILGQIDIDSHQKGEFEGVLIGAVRQVARELGQRWAEIDTKQWIPGT